MNYQQQEKPQGLRGLRGELGRCENRLRTRLGSWTTATLLPANDICVGLFASCQVGSACKTMGRIMLVGFLAIAYAPTPAAAQLPDLAVTRFSLAGQPVAGQFLSVSYVITNLGAGTASGNWFDRVTLSSNSTLSGTIKFWRTTGYNGGYHNLPGNGGSQTNTQTLDLPAIPTGTYFLIAHADEYDVVNEPNEGNNIQALAVAVVSPDLAVTNLTWTGRAAAGQTLTVSYVITNIGAGFANGNWWDQIMLSTNNTLSGVVQAWTTPGYDGGPHNLPGGGNQTITQYIPLRTDIPAGNYYLIAQADNDNQVFEASEVNNTQALPLTIGNSDLAAGGLTIIGQPIAGRRINVSWATTNAGTYNVAGNWHDSLTLSSNSTLAGAIQTLPSFGYHILSPGGTYVQGRTVDLPQVAAGTYYWIARSDSQNWVAENNEANNTVAFPFFLTNLPPTITLLEPTNIVPQTSCIPVSLSLSAQAQPGSYSITNVLFYDGASVIGTRATPPYAISSSQLAHGTHTITAQVVDNFGLRATSQVATVTVNWPASRVMLVNPITNRACVICMGAEPGSNYAIETTTNLQGAIWRSLRTNLVTGPALIFTNQTDLPNQFFRARLVP